MLTFLGIIVLVIFVHELGHYVAARAMGVADSFSIGFGKVLLKKKLWRTEWRLSLLPLGGYIKPRGKMIITTEKRPRIVLGCSRGDELLLLSPVLCLSYCSHALYFAPRSDSHTLTFTYPKSTSSPHRSGGSRWALIKYPWKCMQVFGKPQRCHDQNLWASKNSADQSLFTSLPSPQESGAQRQETGDFW